MAKYCDMSFTEVFELNAYEFYYLLRDSVIYNYSKTEEGQKYLDKCWRLEQTSADKEKLREFFGKGEKQIGKKNKGH